MRFGIKKFAIISTVAVVGVTGTTVAVTSMLKPKQVEEEKIVIDNQSEGEKEVEEKGVDESTTEVSDEKVESQEVVTEEKTEEVETVTEQTPTNTTPSSNTSNGSATTNSNSGTTNSTTTSNDTSSSTTNNNTDINNNSDMEIPKVEEPKVDTPVEPQYKTIKLFEKTTYNGFVGYFTDSENIVEVDLIKYGITQDYSEGISLYFTEYRDVESGAYLMFACSGYVMESEFMDFVWEVGPGSVYVKTIK